MFSMSNKRLCAFKYILRRVIHDLSLLDGDRSLKEMKNINQFDTDYKPKKKKRTRGVRENDCYCLASHESKVSFSP